MLAVWPSFAEGLPTARTRVEIYTIKNYFKMFVARLTGRFVSTNRLFRDLQYLYANSLSSPVRKFKILAVKPSIAEGFPSTRVEIYTI